MKLSYPYRHSDQIHFLQMEQFRQKFVLLLSEKLDGCALFSNNDLLALCIAWGGNFRWLPSSMKRALSSPIQMPSGVICHILIEERENIYFQGGLVSTIVYRLKNTPGETISIKENRLAIANKSYNILVDEIIAKMTKD